MLRITTTCTRCRHESVRSVERPDDWRYQPLTHLPNGWKVNHKGHLLLCGLCVEELT